MNNVPDDWGNYKRACVECGQGYHASEGGCDCVDLTLEATEQRIWAAVHDVASWLTGAIEVGPGGIVTLPPPLAKVCGYHDENPIPLYRDNRETLIKLLRQVARQSGEAIEVRVTEPDGETWTDGTIE